MDNLIRQLEGRPTDTTGFVPLKTPYFDRNFVSLQDGIQGRDSFYRLPGIVTNPNVSVAGMCVLWDAFTCLAPGGILCTIPSGNVGLSSADPSIARIDLLTVNPEVVYDDDGEINYSGIASVVLGSIVFGFAVMPGCPETRLKLAEFDIPAGATVITQRTWRPNYVVPPMAQPYASSAPDMYVQVDPYRGFIGDLTLVNFTGSSILLTSPGSSGAHRIDLISLTTGAALCLTTGVGVTAPSIPVAPSWPSGVLPIAEVHTYGEQEFITQAGIKDVRPFASTLGAATIAWGSVTGKPTSPSLEEMATEHEDDGTHTLNKIWTTLSFAYVSTLGVKATFAPALVAPCDLTIDKAYGYVKTTAVGNTIIVDLLINGASIFAAQADRINILSGQNANESSTPANVTIVKNDIVTASILAVPAGATPGADLTAHLRCLQSLVAGA